MGDHRPRTIFELLQANTTALSRLQFDAQKLHKTQQLLDHCLQPPLRGQLQVVRYERGQLLLHAASGSWLQRARFSREQILHSLRQAGLTDLRGLELLVRPRAAPAPVTPPPLFQRQLSPASGERLQQLGENLGGGLGAALQRLARLANKTPR